VFTGIGVTAIVGFPFLVTPAGRVDEQHVLSRELPDDESVDTDSDHVTGGKLTDGQGEHSEAEDERPREV
jgi:hypothetical protein